LEVILLLLITSILTLALSYVDGMLNSIVPVCLRAEQYMATILGNGGFQSTFNLIFTFGVSLIVLKFLKKGFDTYIVVSIDIYICLRSLFTFITFFKNPYITTVMRGF
jgi:hypothetical protein